MSEDLNVYYDILSSKWWYFDGLSGQWIEYESPDDGTDKFRRSDTGGERIRANTYDRGSRMDSFEKVNRLSSYESGGRIRSFEKMKNLEEMNRKKYVENDQRILMERRRGNEVTRQLARSSTTYVKMNDNKYIYKKTNRVREYEEPPPPRRILNHTVREERSPTRKSIAFDLPKRQIEDYPQTEIEKPSYEKNLYREPRRTLRRPSPESPSFSRQYDYYYENEKRLDDVDRYERDEDDLEYQPEYGREYVKREYEKAEYEKDQYEYEYSVDESYRQRYPEAPYRYNERYQNDRMYSRTPELVNEYDDRVYRKKELRVYEDRDPSVEKKISRHNSHVYESAYKSAPKYNRGGRYIPDPYEAKSILKHSNMKNLSDSENNSPRNVNDYNHRYDEHTNWSNKNRILEPKPKEIRHTYVEPDYPYSNVHIEPAENMNEAEVYNENDYYDNAYIPKENTEQNIEQGLEMSEQQIPEDMDEQPVVENEYADDYTNQFQNDYENEYLQESPNEYPLDYANECTTPQPSPVYDEPMEKRYDNMYENVEPEEGNTVTNTAPNEVTFKIKEQKIDTSPTNKTTNYSNSLEPPSKNNMNNKKELSIEAQSLSCGTSELSERINNLIQEPKKQVSYQGSSSELLGKLISESMSVSRLPSLSNQSVNTSDISKGIGDNFFNKKIGRSDTNRMSVTFSDANPKSIEIEKEKKGRSNLKTMNLSYNRNESQEDNTSEEDDDCDGNSKEHDTDSSVKDKEKYKKDLDDFSNAPLVRRATRSLTFKDQGGLSGCLKVYLEKKNELMASSSNEGTNSIMEIKMANLKRRARELARRYRIKKGIIDENQAKEEEEEQEYPGMTKFEKLMIQVQKQKKLEMKNKEQTTL